MNKKKFDNRFMWNPPKHSTPNKSCNTKYTNKVEQSISDNHSKPTKFHNFKGEMVPFKPQTHWNCWTEKMMTLLECTAEVLLHAEKSGRNIGAELQLSPKHNRQIRPFRHKSLANKTFRSLKKEQPRNKKKDQIRLFIDKYVKIPRAKQEKPFVE